MDAASKKAYVIAITVQVILTGMAVISKAAFNAGMSTFVFVFYRQAAGSILMLPLALFLQRKNAWSMPFPWLLKLFLCALVGNTLSLSLYHVSLKFTSATVAAAAGNSMPVVTFCLALLLRMEVVKLNASGIAKLAGVALCLAGVFAIAFYSGPALSPVNHQRAFHTHASVSGHANASSKTTWIEGTFLMVLANMAWLLCSRSCRTRCWWPLGSAFSVLCNPSSLQWQSRGTSPGGSSGWTSACSPSSTLVLWWLECPTTFKHGAWR
uniref:WAT1-related protein n=1 Tax=Setaria viridis TaxID=4556 RepID=A0A4U6VU26_SETVI|nr:hypothetical protein SEVIR_2G171100v2 [Setaria viridis]TKW32485.1 hypothetical protein SEVIR_2G171100v2 [Setaria viridis]